MRPPLDDILVLDLSRVLAGPFATQRLADLGARVIKVESPSGDPTRGFGPPFVQGEAPYFMAYNRGKESIVLDLRTAAGREVVARLAERADVLIENFRPGVLARLGFDDERLTGLNADLIRCSINGWGSDGPRASDPAFDLAVQAESGLMAMTGEADGDPCRVPMSLADAAAGLAAAEAILAALVRRARDGCGAGIEVSLIDALLSIFGYQAQSVLVTGETPARMGGAHPNLVPYQAFPTRDGHLVLAVATDSQLEAFVRQPGIPDDLARPEWATNARRVEGREVLVPRLREVFASRETAAWLESLSDASIPAAAVRPLPEVLADPERREGGLVARWRHTLLGDLEMVSSPIRWEGGVRHAASGAPPLLGEHTRAVLSEVAGDDDELARWLQDLNHDGR